MQKRSHRVNIDSDVDAQHGRVAGEGDPASETKWRIDFLYYSKRYQECLLELQELPSKSPLTKESLEISTRCHIALGEFEIAEKEARQLVQYLFNFALF